MADTVMTGVAPEGDDNASPKPVQSIEIEPPVAEEDAPEGGFDDGANEAHIGGGDGRALSNEQYKALKAIADLLTDFKVKKGNEDHVPSILFRRIPNRRNMPEYHSIITEPRAISTLKSNIQRKSYNGGVPEFVRDFALIVHNAQVYNRPNSQPVRDVLLLQTIFQEELQKLVEKGLVKEEETVFPDLGVIPAATPESDPVSDEEGDDAEDDGEDEDDEEDGDDSDEDSRKKRRRGGRQSLSGRKQGREEDDDGGKEKEEDVRKRRGRPPKVDTPMEARIKAVLKGLRKPKEGTDFRIRHFEKLPDKIQYPHYYQEIKEPIALDTIKKKSKRKKYTSLEHFMVDITKMFRNAMAYNEDSSIIYQDAEKLLSEARTLAQIEKNKPDEDFVSDEGRLPLPDGILYKGEMWKVGDWIHIQNPNDVTKPIVAQIYRTWQTPEGQKWINACWYYRPEQTVHQYEKHFFKDEVVKTGQYRDHNIEEVTDRCFVMFFTRYSRGRPRNLDPSKSVYVCEARYNEIKHKFNKIKTWASCLPDEVRDKDYEMDLFDTGAIGKIKKIPSPIKHLLKPDAKETDDMPSPEWRDSNAPPLVGAVHKHPRDENQSPPPEPTPPPPPTPPPAPLRIPSSSLLPHQQPRPSMDRQASGGHGLQPSQMTRPSPSMTPQMPNYPTASASPAPQFGRQPPYQHIGATHPYASGMPQTPAQQQTTPYIAQQQLHAPPALSAAHPTSYAGATPSQGYGRTPAMPTQQTSIYPSFPQPNASEPRDQEVYVLSDAANASIPKEIRDQFPQDDQGRLLFFTKPPVDNRRIFTDPVTGKPLVHTQEYLKARAARKERIRFMKENLQAKMAEDERKRKAAQVDYPSLPPGFFGEERDADGLIPADPVKALEIRAYREKVDAEEKAAAEAKAKNDREVLAARIRAAEQKIDAEHISNMEAACRRIIENTPIRIAEEYRARYGEHALGYLNEDFDRAARNAEKWAKEKEEEDEYLRKCERINAEKNKPVRLDQNFWTGRYPDGTGRFEDDYDNRLPK